MFRRTRAFSSESVLSENRISDLGSTCLKRPGGRLL